MSLLTRLLSPRDEGRAPLRPLWHAVVARARDPRWFARCGVADTVAGRFDTVALVMALALLRMEREDALIGPAARLTELFVADMDGQLRQSGVGDLVVGKHIGKLMGVLGGRLDALRDALPLGIDAVMPVVARNLTLGEGADPRDAADFALGLAGRLGATSAADLLAGHIAP